MKDAAQKKAIWKSSRNVAEVKLIFLVPNLLNLFYLCSRNKHTNKYSNICIKVSNYLFDIGFVVGKDFEGNV